MAKKGKADYAEQLVNLDQGDTEGSISIELDETSQAEPTEQETASPEVPEENVSEETATETVVELPNEKANELFRQMQSERDTFKSQFEGVRSELDNLKNLMNLTVQNAQAMQQQPPQAQAPQKPQWFDPIEANDPDSPSYKWLREQERQELRRTIREEVTQTIQQERQRMTVEDQVGALKNKYNVSDDEITKLHQKYSKPGTLTYIDLYEIEHKSELFGQATQQAKKEGIETVSRQVAKTSKPSIAQTAGANRPPEKKSPEEKEMEAHWDRIMGLDKHTRDAATLGLPVAEK